MSQGNGRGAPDDVRGLNIMRPGAGTPSPQMVRMREQLRAADVIVNEDRGDPTDWCSEPEEVRDLRHRGVEYLEQARYESAEEAFLDAIDAGLAYDHFSWSAAFNLVNCHRFMARPEEAETTAVQLSEMFERQPDHPIHYMLATQRGAFAADRFERSHARADADEALDWARRAYDWMVAHRPAVDGMRAYNLIVALLRVGRRDEALTVFHRHQDDTDFDSVWRQGDKAGDIERLIGG